MKEIKVEMLLIYLIQEIISWSKSSENKHRVYRSDQVIGIYFILLDFYFTLLFSHYFLVFYRY